MARRAHWWTGAVAACVAGCGAPPPTSPPLKTAAAAEPAVAWQERFSGPLAWGSPSGASESEIERVFHVTPEGVLHARHDARSEGAPPAVHLGHAFLSNPPELARHRMLSFRWRVLVQPDSAKEPWKDLAASVYVISRQPSLLSGGQGVKLGWVSAPAATGTYQRGILQIPLRSDAAGPAWRSERVDLCALWEASFGSCAGERVRYVGVVTDADDTHSLAEAEYDDFLLE